MAALAAPPRDRPAQQDHVVDQILLLQRAEAFQAALHADVRAIRKF
jgi:hypothetical protein